MVAVSSIPSAFIWRRLHSLTGLFLVLYLIEHLLVNSQAALFIGSDGTGFIEAVNGIHRLPFLPILEMVLLGVPIIIHAAWGIVYLRTGKMNTIGDTGTTPYLPEYPRNHAYTWQRITSWILLFAIVAHVIHMRFIEYPSFAQKGSEHFYMVRLNSDDGLPTLAARLNVTLYDDKQIQKIATAKPTQAAIDSDAITSLKRQELKQQQDFIRALEKRPLRSGEVIAVGHDFGTATLLMVRDTFKMPIMLALYTIFVLAACFHAFNGFWTFMITWGVTQTERSQKLMRTFSTFLLCLVAFLGLAAIWITYWINLFN